MEAVIVGGALDGVGATECTTKKLCAKHTALIAETMRALVSCMMDA